MAFKTIDDVETYLSTLAEDASPARRWQVVRTATRRLLAAYGVPNASKWTVSPLPHQATGTYGRCTPWTRLIEYRRSMVELHDHSELAATIIHEVAHAVCYKEDPARTRGVGRKRADWHGSMWKGQMAAMGLKAPNRFI